MTRLVFRRKPWDRNSGTKMLVMAAVNGSDERTAITSPLTTTKPANDKAQQPAHAGRTYELGKPSVAWPVRCSAWLGRNPLPQLGDTHGYLLRPQVMPRTGPSDPNTA